jgi:undecaprenyl-diphosphatase
MCHASGRHGRRGEPVIELDARLFRVLQADLSGSSTLLFLMAALTVLGSGWSMLALIPLLVRARTRGLAAALIGTLASASLLVFVGKQVVRRARPFAALDGVHALVFAPPTDFSFPSGHAAGSFAFAAFASVLLLSRAPGASGASRERTPRRWLAAASLLLVAAGIALSRVALGVHFPGDVGVGALVGILTGTAGGRLYLAVRAPVQNPTVR